MTIASDARAPRAADASFPFRLRVAAILATAALFLPVGPAFADADGAVSGTVETVDGTAVTDASVDLVDLRLRTRVDDDGRFRFADVPPGQYLLRAESPLAGELTRRITVEAGDDTEVTLALNLVSHDDEVVVTGSVVARSQLELAQPTTVLIGEELRFRQQPTLGETLAQEAGVSSTFFGQGASRPVIRGVGGDRVRMLHDGVDVGDASSTSPDHAVSIETASAERIEILHGPSTLLYGSSAIGGVVNVIDGRIPSRRAERPISGYLDLSGGTVADERTAALSVEGGGGDWAWHVDGAFREGDSYEIPGFAELEGEHDEHEEDGEEHDEDGEEHEEHEEEPAFGEVPNTDFETESGTIGFTRFVGDSGFFGFSVSTFGTDYGVPGEHAEHGEEGEHGDEEEHGEEEEHDEEGEHDEHGEGGIRIDLERIRYDFHGEITRPFGVFQGAKLRVGVVDYEHAELEGEEREIGTEFFTDAVDARLELIQQRRGNLSGSWGAQFTRREIGAVGAEAYVPFNDADTLALFTFQEIERPDSDVRFQFGARFETQDNELDDGSLSRSFDGFSASAGLVWEPAEGYAIAASLARSTKLPNGEELYSNGPHFATQAFEIGDPNLDEETSLGIDLSLRKTEGRLTGEISLFQNEYDDFIFRTFTGEEEDGLPVLLYRQRDAEFQGAELKARLGLWEDGLNHLDLSVTGDVVRAEFDDGSGDLPRIPPSRLGVGLHYHARTWHAYVEYWDVAEQDRVSENETPTDGYGMLNAGISYRWIAGDQIYDVVLRGRNLGDEEARNHVSFLKNQAPLPGRDVSLAVRWTF
ncbi:MAG: TonB-dependent receptor [Acidobacteriota bacterium]